MKKKKLFDILFISILLLLLLIIIFYSFIFRNYVEEFSAWNNLPQSFIHNLSDPDSADRWIPITNKIIGPWDSLNVQNFEASGFSVSFWIYFDTNDSHEETSIINVYDTNGNKYFYIGVHDKKPTLKIRSGLEETEANLNSEEVTMLTLGHRSQPYFIIVSFSNDKIEVHGNLEEWNSFAKMFERTFVANLQMPELGSGAVIESGKTKTNTEPHGFAVKDIKIYPRFITSFDDMNHLYRYIKDTAYGSLWNDIRKNKGNKYSFYLDRGCHFNENLEKDLCSNDALCSGILQKKSDACWIQLKDLNEGEEEYDVDSAEVQMFYPMNTALKIYNNLTNLGN